ncbi:putative ATP-dependent RNA helicase ucp12 [Diplonema papillatum]|nr:putative ATP-dependent RNA helicase ucp12 [Diplonema papillatum]
MLRRTHIRNYVITKHRSAVLDGIRSARVVLIQAPTGSGKSTQVPQYILNEWKDARILHTQPRKLSTLLLSRRVAEERGASVGEEVGYAYRGGHACRDDTALLYCTTGVALEVLSRPQRAGSKLTHVIVDEVHERSVFVDLLFVLLRTRLPDVKVVLMSATADAATLTSYFGGETQCPTLQCGAGPAEHPVAIEYLEAAAGVIQRAERTPSDLRSATVNETAERLLRALVASGGVRAGHSVLIFLATVGEVVQLSKNLEDLETADGVTVTVSQLYSANKYAASQQLTLLHKGPQMNSIFIYVATNVAETGLTLPHVSHVIDTGLVLQKMYDAHQNLHRYEKGPISVKSSLQRSGRTGRTCPGTVYRLWKADKQLPAETPPDVTTTKLDVTALKMISFGYGNVEEIMSKMPTAPAAFAVESAVANLASLGLVVQKECEWVLTDLGTAVAGLPVEPALGRLLLLSAFLGCVEPALMIVAAATKMTQTASHHVAGSQLHFGSSSASDAFRDLNSDLLVHAQLYRAYTRQLERGPSNADLQKTFR